VRVSTFLAGALFILAGVVLFMEKLGYSWWGFSGQVLSYWPVILIIIGISLFWGGKIPRWLAFAFIVILVGGVVALALVAPKSRYPFLEDRRTTLTVDHTQYAELSAGELSVRFGGGRINLGSSAGNWFEGDFRGHAGAASSVEEQKGRLKIALRQPQRTWRPGRDYINNWEMFLSPDLPWDISLHAGAVEGNLNLVGIPLRNLKIELGAGALEVKLGDNGSHTAVKISSGASDIRIKVPEDTGVSVTHKGALTDTNLKELGWAQVSDRYISPGYEEAAARIDLNIETAVGHFQLEVLPASRLMPGSGPANQV
jgi:hypothetical protein